MEVERIALELRNLQKYYGNNLAVDGASFKVHTGDIHGFLGPNGAGKSTTLKMIAGILKPDGGEIQFHGLKGREEIGFLSEQAPLYEDMNVIEYLNFVLSIRSRAAKTDRVHRVASLIEKLDLTSVKKRLVGHLSLGYRQRVAIAQSIVHNPRFVILDEPMRGLDPQAVKEMRNLIVELAKEHTLIFSSHVLSEISKICNRISVINQGKIIASGSVEEIEKLVKYQKRYSIRTKEEIDLNWLGNQCDFSFSQLTPGFLDIQSRDLKNPLPELIKLLSQKYSVLSAGEQEHDLEEVFIDLTQNKKKQESIHVQ